MFYIEDTHLNEMCHAKKERKKKKPWFIQQPQKYSWFIIPFIWLDYIWYGEEKIFSYTLVYDEKKAIKREKRCESWVNKI